MAAAAMPRRISISFFLFFLLLLLCRCLHSQLLLLARRKWKKAREKALVRLLSIRPAPPFHFVTFLRFLAKPSRLLFSHFALLLAQGLLVGC